MWCNLGHRNRYIGSGFFRAARYGNFFPAAKWQSRRGGVGLESLGWIGREIDTNWQLPCGVKFKGVRGMEERTNVAANLGRRMP